MYSFLSGLEFIVNDAGRYAHAVEATRTEDAGSGKGRAGGARQVG